MLRWLVVLALSVLPAPALPAPVTAPHVTVDLVAETTSVQPGHALATGLRFAPENGWHVYWSNPGDSGEAPSVAWTLPPGFVADPIAWPAPELIPVGPLANFGYEGTTLLPVTVRVPADLAASTVELRVRARWLVCNEDECIPGTAPLGLTLPVRADPPAPSAEATLFAATRAREPVPAPADWRLSASAERDRLTLELRGVAAPAGTRVFFFPYRGDVIEHAAPQTLTPIADGFRLDLRRSPSSSSVPAALEGVLALGDRAWAIRAPVGAPGFATWPLVLAFAGGLLLNLMPCVFPILALKAFALVGMGGSEQREARLHGVAYTAGVLASFAALATVLIVVRTAGTPLGWGFQLQSPIVVAALAGLFFWLALVLLGVSTVGGSLVGAGNRLATAGGSRGAFFTGVLATVVATPCSAPFMGTALGYALVQPPPVAFAVFLALGFGLAFPYLALAWVPGLGRRLPRPGRWMETLKELLAFPLLGTVVWLTWVASLQGGPPAVAAILSMLLLLAIAAWTSARWTTRAARFAAAAAVVAALATGASIGRLSAPPAAAEGGWERYSAARLDELLGQGTPVFVDFTAAWCITCQVNERLVLGTPAVRAKMRELGVVPVRADWTTPDPEITRALQQFGRDGVPLYVLYSGREEDPPRILPQLLTSDLVITELEQLDRRSPT